MNSVVRVKSAGPGVTLQDLGRPGQFGIGLSPSGAADRRAHLEGEALLSNPPGLAAIEMAVLGGTFEFSHDTMVALTGAVMQASLNGDPVVWNACLSIRAGDILNIGAATSGVYGYMSIVGGFDAREELGGRGFHGIAKLGTRLEAGDSLAIGAAKSDGGGALMRLPERGSTKAPLRVMDGPQSHLFDNEMRARFEATEFTRSPRGNRQGVRLDQDGAPFSTGEQLTLVSDFIAAGDIQMTGDGTPYVLLADCQTMGGYPRIGTVLPADLGRIAQAVPGQKLQFQFVTLGEVEQTWVSDGDARAAIQKSLEPMLRDPRDITNLLSYELISRPVIDD